MSVRICSTRPFSVGDCQPFRRARTSGSIESRPPQCGSPDGYLTRSSLDDALGDACRGGIALAHASRLDACSASWDEPRGDLVPGSPAGGQVVGSNEADLSRPRCPRREAGSGTYWNRRARESRLSDPGATLLSGAD